MKKVILITAVVSAGLLLLELLLAPAPESRNWEFFPDMARSMAYRSQSSNPHFPDQKTQRKPVAGTIARGYMPFAYGASAEEARRAGQELQNPLGSGRSFNPELGGSLWKTYCQTCHGADGGGGGPVTKRGYPPPPSLLSERVRAMKDGQLFHLVTLGYRNMPAYASQIERQDRWQVVEYLRQLQENQP